jgi:hypothetical protein
MGVLWQKEWSEIGGLDTSRLQSVIDDLTQDGWVAMIIMSQYNPYRQFVFRATFPDDVDPDEVVNNPDRAMIDLWDLAMKGRPSDSMSPVEMGDCNEPAYLVDFLQDMTLEGWNVLCYTFQPLDARQGTYLALRATPEKSLRHGYNDFKRDLWCQWSDHAHEHKVTFADV